jgi:uncharacterized membrane protein
MHWYLFPLSEDNVIEASVSIKCPVQSVYQFYRDFKNLPRFLGDVTKIEQTGPETSRWTVQGPLGIRAHWTVKITEMLANELIRYETVGPSWLKTYWEIRFSPGPSAGTAEVREFLRVPLGKVGRTLLRVMGKSPREELAANLYRLKEVMEGGVVTDLSYSVPGKFNHPPRKSTYRCSIVRR